MVIRVLTFEGCPNSQATKDLVQRTLGELHVQAEVEHIQVQNQEEAIRYHFLGSPSIQVDGQDIEMDRRADEPSFACRVYRTPAGLSGVPPRRLLVDALEQVQRKSS